jgi:sulfur transfer protein SufE
MGDFYDEATRAIPACEDRVWHNSYISSDRDWHFEGNIKCTAIDTA